MQTDDTTSSTATLPTAESIRAMDGAAWGRGQEAT